MKPNVIWHLDCWVSLRSTQPTSYLYNDEGLIAESQQAITQNADQSTSASAAPTLVNQYGPRPNNPYSTGVLFVKTKNSNNQSVYAYYHHDHLNTPIQATDKQGKVVWAAQYSAFGQVTITTPTPTGENPVIESSLRFPGQIEDQETGLYYNWRRYYDPEIGRYVTADPIGLDGGMNLYSYVGGDPVNRMDPFGLKCVSRGGTTTCSFPYGSQPTVSFRTPEKWEDFDGKKSNSYYHHYDKNIPVRCGKVSDILKRIIDRPTPGTPQPATPNGTKNDATPNGFFRGLIESPVKSYITKDQNGNTVVVNVTQSGHPLHSGYVIRTVENGVVHNYGEGVGFPQSDFTGVIGDKIDEQWYPETDNILNCECKN
jgi:RHS repeat-associated protein